MGPGRSKSEEDGRAAQTGPTGQHAGRRSEAFQSGTTQISADPASRVSQTDTTGSYAVYSSPEVADRNTRSAQTPGAPESGLTQPQTAIPCRGKAGTGRSGEVPKARQEWQDKSESMRKHLQNNPHVRIEGVDGKALALAHESLERDCEAAVERSSLERTRLSQKARFNFRMEPFAMRPKNEGHASNVMETLFMQPVRMTVFDAPEYQGPWRHDCAPKWTMGISDASGPQERESASILKGNDHVRLTNPIISLELFHLSSPMYSPMSYPSWRENIRAAWVLLGTHYRVEELRSSKCSTRIAVALPRDGNEEEVSLPLAKLKHIAQAVIYFESALQMLMLKAPAQRRNWQDNKSLQGKSRSGAMATIGRALTIHQLSTSFSPKVEGGSGGWCWYFFKRSEVVFEQPGAIQTADIVIRTLEYVLPFIEVCLDIQNVRQLESYTPDLHGFQSFISRPASRSLMQRVMRKPDQVIHPQPCHIPITAVSGPRRRRG